VVNQVSFSPDGKKMASSSLDDSLRIWNEESEKNFYCSQVIAKYHPLQFENIQLEEAKLDEESEILRKKN
jgi:WD40 repeat protein